MTLRDSWLGLKPFVRRVVLAPGINPLIVGPLRGLSPSKLLARIPIRADEVDGVVRDVRYTLVRPDICSIAKELYWSRGVRSLADEQFSLELFSDLARFADVVFDIGANTGVFTLVASLSNPQVRVHAFEIVPDIYEVLFRNVIRNNVADRVECHFLGVGKAQVLQLPRLSRAGTLPTSFSSDTATSTGTSVEFRRLDTFLPTLAPNARVLMKIDVEGTESDIFANGWSFVSQTRPTIVCEILRGAPKLRELTDALLSHGYRFFNITDRGLHETRTVHPAPDFRDWLFLHGDTPLQHATRVPVVT